MCKTIVTNYYNYALPVQQKEGIIFMFAITVRCGKYPLICRDFCTRRFAYERFQLLIAH